MSGQRMFFVEQRLVGKQCSMVEASSKAEAVRKVRALDPSVDSVGFEITEPGGYVVTEYVERIERGDA